MLDEHDRFVGREFRELRARLGELTNETRKRSQYALAAELLLRHTRCRRPKDPHPSQLRAAVFAKAGARPFERERVIADAAAELGLQPTEVDTRLFADLPNERRVEDLRPRFEPSDLALHTNLAIVQRLLFRATSVEIEIAGNARAVVRFAKFRGLIVLVRPALEPGNVTLEISGPYALFRRTLVYGRALAELVPQLAWAHRYILRASCVVDGRVATLELRSGAAILPREEPKRFDSGLEERLYKQLARLAPDWEIIRESEPIDIGTQLIFPDFKIYAREDPSRWCLLEIVGFWTPEYVKKKVEAFKSVDAERFVVCVDEALGVTESELPRNATIIPFRRRIDARVVHEKLKLLLGP